MTSSFLLEKMVFRMSQIYAFFAHYKLNFCVASSLVLLKIPQLSHFTVLKWLQNPCLIKRLSTWYFLFSWTIFTCEFNWVWSLKTFWQILHSFSFINLWTILKWFFKPLLLLNSLSQISHLGGFWFKLAMIIASKSSWFMWQYVHQRKIDKMNSNARGNSKMK